MDGYRTASPIARLGAIGENKDKKKTVSAVFFVF